MNSASLSSLASILAAPLRQRRNQGSLWSLVLIAGLCAILPSFLFVAGLYAAVKHGKSPATWLYPAAQVAGPSLVVLAGLWWCLFVANVLEQNHPTQARLVPGHPRRLRTALLLAWGALVVGAGVMAAVLLPAWRVDALAVAVITGTVLSLIAVIVRWPKIGLLWLALSLANAAMPSILVEARGVAVRQWQAQSWTLVVTVLAATAVLLWALIQEGGARHAVNYEARRQRTNRFQAHARGERPRGADGRTRFDGLLARPYDWWMAHLIAKRDSSVSARLMLGLGPDTHWTTVLAGAVGMAVALQLLLFVAAVVNRVFPGAHFALSLAVAGVAFGPMIGLMASAMLTRARLYQTRGEQALLALLPGAPRGAALSRGLSLRMNVQCLLAWGSGLAAVGLVGVTASAGAAETHRYLGFVGYVTIGALALAALQWPCWARLAAPGSLAGGRSALAGLGIPLLVFVGDLTQQVAFATSAPIVVAGVLAWCAWRWHRMGTEPTAFPVGRLR